MSKPRYNRIVNLTEEEDAQVTVMQSQNIAVNEIFRRGLRLYATDVKFKKLLATNDKK